MIKEIWKDIPNYEGLYKASNFGNIKSLDRIVIDNNKKRKRKMKGKIIKQISRDDGYLFVNLSKNGKSKPIKVHKIIGNTFIKNKNNYKCINHIDGNKQNNNVSNLEWCSYSHNLKEAYRLGFKKPHNLRGKDIYNAKSVYQYDLYGNFIKEWECIKEASKKLKINDGNITLCCKKIRKTAGGYVWKYKEVSNES